MYLCGISSLQHIDMKVYRTKSAFESAFKKFVNNFDETKIWFTYDSNKVNICFVEDGRLQQFPMYKSEYYIQLDGWRFIEFLETGKFPKQHYVMLYSDDDINHEDIGKVFEFYYIRDKNTDMFHYNNKNVNDFLNKYRVQYPDCGLKQLPKPGTSTFKNTEF